MQLHRQCAVLFFALLLCFMSVAAYADREPDILESNFITVSVNSDSAAVHEIGDKGTAVSLGSEASFRLTSRVPAMDGFDSYTYTVHNTLSDGLTFHGKDNVKVAIDSTPYTDFSVKQAGQSFTIDFPDFIDQKNMAGKEIVITYTATLNEKALATDRETNTVTLEYSSGPDQKKTSMTGEKIVYVYDFDIAIDTYTGNVTAGTRLPDAMFVLKNSEGDYYQYTDSATKNAHVGWVPIDDCDVPDTEDLTLYQIKKAWEKLGATVVVTDQNGVAKFQGLEAGRYALKEIAAPEGYDLPVSEIPVVITVAYKYDGTLKDSASSAACTGNGQYCQIKRVENKPGSILSAAGGMGTATCYVAGSVLALGTAVLLITGKYRNWFLVLMKKIRRK